MYKSFTQVFDSSDMEKTVMQCAWTAKYLGYTMYGVQSYGQCWGCANDFSYAKHGASSSCEEGVGADGANYAYKISN